MAPLWGHPNGDIKMQYIEMVKADQAAIVLSYRQAKAKGMTIHDYMAEYEYKNINDVIAYINEAKRLDATVFNGVSDDKLTKLIRDKIKPIDLGKIVIA